MTRAARLPASRWLLTLGVIAMGSETGLVLDSRGAVRTPLLVFGLACGFPHPAGAA
ncbi:MAG: hypothetical protein ABJC89_27725 [Acidobacteriota bacterium]